MRIFITILLCCVLSCRHRAGGPPASTTGAGEKAGNPDSGIVPPVTDSPRLPSTALYIWQVDVQHKTKTRNPELQESYLNVDSVLKGLNELYPNIRLVKVKISGDTLFTAIKDSEYLGERIGNTGAAQYLAEAVINLTAVRGIRYVQIDFEAGSHATPGLWSAEDFNDYRTLP